MELWGEMEQEDVKTPPSQSVNITEALLKCPAIEVEGANVYHCNQPAMDYEDTAEFFSRCRHVDKVVRHTIALQGHLRKVQMMRSGLAEHCDIKPIEAETLPPIPEMKVDEKFVPSALLLGLRLDATSVRKLLKRAVCVTMLHAGFEVCTDSALETLTDVCHDFLEKFCHQLRWLRDKEAATGSSIYQNIIDHALRESGYSEGLATLSHFYRYNVVDYRQQLIAQCRRAQDEYFAAIRSAGNNAVPAESGLSFDTTLPGGVRIKLEVPLSDDKEYASGMSDVSDLGLMSSGGGDTTPALERDLLVPTGDTDGAAHGIGISPVWSPTVNNRGVTDEDEIVVVENSPPTSLRQAVKRRRNL